MRNGLKATEGVREMRNWLIGWAVLGLTGAAFAQGTTVRPKRPAPPSAPVTNAPAPKPGSEPQPAGTAVAGPDALAERAALKNSAPQKRVLALYYPWYGTPEKSGKWLHQDGVNAEKRTIASHARFPASGPYDSTDPAVIDRHLQQARAAGIDVLVCSWWGRDDATDKAVRALLARAPSFNVSICLLWEKLGKPGDPKAALEELGYLLQVMGRQPGYFKEGGKPVLFLYRQVCLDLSVDRWAEVLTEASRRYEPGVMALGDGGAAVDTLLWDGLYTLGFVRQMEEKSPTVCARVQRDTFRVPILLGRRTGRVSVVTLSPGYDDRKVPLGGERKSPLLVEREEGRLYTALWDQAVKDDPDWVLINSFNQWHAGTEIEPSAELGEQYLTLTRENASRFKRTRQ